MTTSTRPKAVTQVVITPPPLSHAENPDRQGWAVCGRKLTGRHVSASQPRCVVCESLIDGGRFIDR